jgi:hypothetical protein
MKAGGAVPSWDLQNKRLHLKPSESTVHQLKGEHKRLGVLFKKFIVPWAITLGTIGRLAHAGRWTTSLQERAAAVERLFPAQILSPHTVQM